MKIFEVVGQMKSKWGLNKFITILCLNAAGMAFITCLGMNIIPDEPELLEEKENDENE